MQRRMRHLRDKHCISIYELSRHCGVSPQRLSQVELSEGNTTVHLSQLVDQAFSSLISERRNKLAELETDFTSHRSGLLDFIDEERDT